MQERVAGLSVGEDYACAAQVHASSAGGLELVALNWVAADMADPVLAAATLRRLWRTARIRTSSVALCLHSRSVVYKPCSFPALGEVELHAAVALEAEQALQLAAKDVLSDWRENGSGKGARGGLLVAMPRQDAANAVSMLRSAKLYPVALDSACTAAAALYRRLQAVACRDRIVCLTHVTDRSGETVILYGDDGLYARAVHARKGLDTVDYLFSSLQDVLKYFQFKLHFRPVEEMVFTGSVGDPQAFQDRAVAAFAMPVRMWNPLDDLVVPGPVRRAAPSRGWQAGVAPAIGLALRGVADA